jgi:uncharacterized membrane protein
MSQVTTTKANDVYDRCVYVTSKKKITSLPQSVLSIKLNRLTSAATASSAEQLTGETSKIAAATTPTAAAEQLAGKTGQIAATAATAEQSGQADLVILQTHTHMRVE